MTRQRVYVWLRVGFVVVMTPLLFVLLQVPARAIELQADVGMLRLLGVHSVLQVSGPNALVAPWHSNAWFWIEVAPSCSSLASLLTLGCLAAALPRRVAPFPRRLVAYAVAAGAIFLGNMIRIDASIFAGLVDGRASLVLFHDWVGSIFGFAYTMAGFIFMLFVLLPRRKAPATAADALDTGAVSGQSEKGAAVPGLPRPAAVL